MDKQYFINRVDELSRAYDATVERLHSIAGAIQESKLTIQKIEEKEKEDMACKDKGGKKKK